MKTGIANREKEAFSIPENRFHKHQRRADELASRRSVKRFVRPENAAALCEQLPSPGEIVHSILRGDFVLGDALPALLRVTGSCPHLQISTLALSRKNAETLRQLVESGKVGRLSLIVSHYFRAVDKLSTFHTVTQILAGITEVKVARCHAKVILLANACGDAFVFEGSANLRSSDTLEQLTIFNDADLHAFHASWMADLKNIPHKNPA